MERGLRRFSGFSGFTFPRVSSSCSFSSSSSLFVEEDKEDEEEEDIRPTTALMGPP
jgi:hypothetical protein